MINVQTNTMPPNIVTKYKLNTEDFKIFFDNQKKTHVAENIETGEKTNIGVLGIFLEMGILKALDEVDKLSVLNQRINDLEAKLNKIIEILDNIQLQQAMKTKEKTKTYEEEDIEEVEEEAEDIEERSFKPKKSKFDIREKIMEKPLKKISKEVDEVENVRKEAEEEIDAWEEI